MCLHIIISHQIVKKVLYLLLIQLKIRVTALYDEDNFVYNLWA